jgi:hypothetical protein
MIAATRRHSTGPMVPLVVIIGERSTVRTTQHPELADQKAGDIRG